MARQSLSDAFASLAFGLMEDLFSIYSIAVSHPIYLAYVVFFSPYLFAVVCFLSPLLFTTSILLLSLSTAIPCFTGRSSSPVFCGKTIHFVLQALNWRPDTELQACWEGPGAMGDDDDVQEKEEEEENKRIVLEALEAIGKLYKAMTYEVEEIPVRLALELKTQTIEAKDSDDLPRVESPSDLRIVPCVEAKGAHFAPENSPEHSSGPAIKLPSIKPVKERLPENQSIVGYDFKVVSCVEGVELPQMGRRSKPAMKTGDRGSPEFRPAGDSRGAGSGELLQRSASSSGRWRGGRRCAAPPPPESLSIAASVGTDNEWRRTLAWKLHEERLASDGGEEGMDLLWETYELGSGSRHLRTNPVEEEEEEEEKAEEGEEDDGEGGDMVGRLCCLRALRLSTGKMNLGMGRSNLRRISTAVKGVGALGRSLTRSRSVRD
ncbi:unnamed protein product [Spirodela intermedia]|uniref:Uncharacterized protein n=2 Tax=Spirodela intermedia TaxID=51605 RepID=A0A7I8JDF8_SPIIN|nr:unnamed protein product [Spirodela intermedia]CAA6668167.1 unnamed protein product [Spirodela intermedia]CAA7405000.1 unnamed protein product [Spirodela intermedia]